MKDEKNIPKIQRLTFLGYADTVSGDELFEEVVKVAEVCASNGYTIINGGGPGVMKASTVGAKKAGGKVIGVTFYPKDIPIFEGRDEENEVDELIVTDSYLERTLKLLELGQVNIIFNGGTGTISEFGMAWGLARLYFGHHKPLILYGDFWQEIIFAFTKNMFIRPEERMVFKIVDKPEQVIEAINEFKKMILVLPHNHANPIFEI
jgi:hypothetical protein